MCDGKDNSTLTIKCNGTAGNEAEAGATSRLEPGGQEPTPIPPSSVVVITDAPVSRLRSAIAANASVMIGLSVVAFFAAGVVFFAYYTRRPHVNTMAAREIEL